LNNIDRVVVAGNGATTRSERATLLDQMDRRAVQVVGALLPRAAPTLGWESLSDRAVAAATLGRPLAATQCRYPPPGAEQPTLSALRPDQPSEHR